MKKISFFLILKNAIFLTIFLQIWLPCLTFSQTGNYYIKNYTTDHGLPNNHVRSIAQDKYGFIWIVTWDAVTRYDGYEFRNYYHSPDDSTSAPGMDNHRVLIDRNGAVWINNALAVWLFDRERDCFISSPDSYINSVNAIALDSSKTLWVSTDSGLFRNTSSNRFEKIHFQNLENIEKRLLDLYFDEKQNCWVRCGDSIFFMKLRKKVSETEFLYDLVYQDLLIDHILSTNFMPVYSAFDSANVNVIAGNIGLYIRDTASGKYVQKERIEEINVIPDGPIAWNTLDETFFLFNHGKKFFSMKPENEGTVESWMKDKNENLWLGIYNSNTEGNGLTKIIFQAYPFHHYLTTSETGESAAVISIFKDHGSDMWIGTVGNNYLYFISKGLSPQKTVYVDKKLMTRSVHSRSLFEFGGKMMAGNSYDLLYRFDKAERKAEVLYPGNIQFVLPDSMNTFKILIEDKKNNLVIAGASGVVIMNHNLDRILYYQNRYLLGDIFAALHDCDSNYWFGANGGLLFVSKNFDKNDRYEISDGKYNIESVIEDDSLHLWLALLGGGLCRFDKRDGSTEIFSTQQGLKNSTCYNVLKDKHGHIWVSTNQGISMFDPETGRFRNFGEAEGLRIVEFNADAVWHGKDDEMMFGGMGGFVSFYPDSVEQTTQDYYAPLHITEMKVSGVNLFPNIYELSYMKLEKGMDNFQLAFACFDYMNAEKLQYRYKLLENDTGWIKTNSRNRYANYINLKPGMYHFSVQATDVNGNWTKETAVEIEIPPFFYQTILFKIALATVITIIVALIFYLIFRYYRLKEKKEREILLHKEQGKRELLKLEALRGQLNPHFIFNSLNSVNDFILDNDPLRANQYLTDFASLMRAFLENSKQEYIPLIKEIELLEHYLRLEQIRYSDRFIYKIDYDEVENIYAEISPSMIQPFTENAVWHGIGKLQNNHKGEIRLIFIQEQDDCIVCRIEDNGIGVTRAEAMKSDQQKQRQSRGISIIRERLGIINSSRHTHYSFNMEEIDPGAEHPGTRVRIELPVKITSDAVGGL